MDNTQAIEWAKSAQENHNMEDLNIRDIVDFLLADDNDREKQKDNTLISVCDSRMVWLSYHTINAMCYDQIIYNENATISNKNSSKT